MTKLKRTSMYDYSEMDISILSIKNSAGFVYFCRNKTP